MTYFVADDVVHTRVGEHSTFVSECGFEYPSLAVDWAGDYEPDAWSMCPACDAVEPDSTHASEDLVLVQGVYAVDDDDAHLRIGRADGAWLSVCGRRDANLLVAWAGDEWPEAYDACPDCLGLVDADLWPPDLPGDEAQSGSAATTTPEERFRAHRVWVIQDEMEHRPRDEAMTAAMCGASLRPGATPLLTPTAEAMHCHECDRAVGRARAAARPPQPRTQAKVRPTTRTRSSPKRHASRRNKSVTKSSRKTPSSTDKEVALFGRRMIVPVRFVRGGLPGLGRRR